jgi:hypothetical protein
LNLTSENSGSPKNVEQKVTVCVYWLKHEAGVTPVTLSHVYTAFKTINWPIPADLANAIQRAGTKNYVNSKNRDDIGLTTHGENLVEHQLTAAQPK